MMLHFLLTIALCIFIGERVGHYQQILKQRRYERLIAGMLAPAPPRIEPPPGPPAAWKLVFLLGAGALVAAGLAAIGNAAMH